MLWLVFDSAAKIDVGALANDPSHAIRSAVLEHGADGEAIVRIKLERPRLVSLEADGPAWIVTIGDTVTVPSTPAGHRAQHRRQGPRQHHHSVRRAAQAASLTDPESATG